MSEDSKRNIDNLDLYIWAYISNDKLERLTKLAEKEKWRFREDEYPYFILKNYLMYTFKRLQKEGKVLVNKEKECAAFNTGLVNKGTRANIYAFFQKNEEYSSGAKSYWYLMDFSIAGQGFYGKQLVELFSPLPEKADYFQGNATDCYGFDSSCKRYCDYAHILKRIYRFPQHFYKGILPDYFSCLDEKKQSGMISDMIEKDDDKYHILREKLKSAVENAEKEVEYNYRIAIPMYNFEKEKISFLFPLALDNEQIDLALIVEKINKKDYQYQTVIPLDWAYINSRLIAPLSNDSWLKKSVMNKESSEQITVKRAENTTTARKLYLLGGEFYRNNLDTEKFFIKKDNVCFLYEHNIENINGNNKATGKAAIYDLNRLKNFNDPKIFFNNYLKMFQNISYIDDNDDINNYDVINIKYLAIEIERNAPIKVYLKLGGEVKINNKPLSLEKDEQASYILSDDDDISGIAKTNIPKFIKWAEQISHLCSIYMDTMLFMKGDEDDEDSSGTFYRDVDLDLNLGDSIFSAFPKFEKENNENSASGSKLISLGLLFGDEPEKTVVTTENNQQPQNNNPCEQQDCQDTNYIDNITTHEKVVEECLNHPQKFVEAEIDLYCKINKVSKNEFTSDMKNLIMGWKLYNPGREYLYCSLDELRNKKDKYLKTYMSYLKDDKRVKFIF